MSFLVSSLVQINRGELPEQRSVKGRNVATALIDTVVSVGLLAIGILSLTGILPIGTHAAFGLIGGGCLLLGIDLGVISRKGKRESSRVKEAEIVNVPKERESSRVKEAEIVNVPKESDAFEVYEGIYLGSNEELCHAKDGGYKTVITTCPFDQARGNPSRSHRDFENIFDENQINWIRVGETAPTWEHFSYSCTYIDDPTVHENFGPMQNFGETYLFGRKTKMRSIPENEWFEPAFQAIRSSEGNVLIHGDKAPLLIAAYLIKEGNTAGTAVRTLKARGIDIKHYFKDLEAYAEGLCSITEH